jgi:hypothetical protein
VKLGDADGARGDVRAMAGVWACFGARELDVHRAKMARE